MVHLFRIQVNRRIHVLSIHVKRNQYISKRNQGQQFSVDSISDSKVFIF